MAGMGFLQNLFVPESFIIIKLIWLNKNNYIPFGKSVQLLSRLISPDLKNKRKYKAGDFPRRLRARGRGSKKAGFRAANIL
jgi:hypothetical protein